MPMFLCCASDDDWRKAIAVIQAETPEAAKAAFAEKFPQCSPAEANVLDATQPVMGYVEVHMS